MSDDRPAPGECERAFAWAKSCEMVPRPRAVVPPGVPVPKQVCGEYVLGDSLYVDPRTAASMLGTAYSTINSIARRDGWRKRKHPNSRYQQSILYLAADVLSSVNR